MRIGILENYQALGDLLELTLKLAGHTVQTTDTIEEFFTRVIFPTPPDLIIVDYWLQAERSGVEVIHEIRVIAPALPAILISAAPLATLHAATAGLSQVTILQKPFPMSVLQETVRSLTQPTKKDAPGKRENG